MSSGLYNLEPLLELIFLALVLLVLPLAWVWRRHASASGQQKMQALVWVTLFLTFDLVMFGAFTRLTDSGLGCPDWPGCYGYVSPVGASASIQEAQIQTPTGPVTFTKAWIEMIHRYLAMMVGGLILVSALHAWWQRMLGDKTSSVMLPTLILVWVCVQGAFGALTVTMKLFPLIVTLHLMGGLTLLGLLTFQVQRHRVMGQAENMASVKPLAWWLTLGGLALLVMQVSLGGWGQHQLCCVGVQHFSAMPRVLVAGDGLRERLWVVAALGFGCTRRCAQFSGLDRHSLQPPFVCVCGVCLFGYVGVAVAPCVGLAQACSNACRFAVVATVDGFVQCGVGLAFVGRCVAHRWCCCFVRCADLDAGGRASLIRCCLGFAWFKQMGVL